MKTSLVLILGCLIGANGFSSALPYLLLRPDGTFILPNGEISSPTQSRTHGLQEAIDRAVEEHLDLYVMGGDYKNCVYPCSSSVVFPPMQGKSIRFGAATLDFNGFENRKDPGLVFDSCMNVFFDCDAQIVYHLDGAAVRFNPKNLLPVDDFVGPTMVASTFHFAAIAHVNTPVSFVGSNGGLPTDDVSVCCVEISPNHSITRCEFKFIELLGGNVGIRVDTPAENSGFAFNRLTGHFVHEQMKCSVMEGTIGGSPLSSSLRGNRWDVHCAPSPGASGMIIRGNHSSWSADVIAEKGPLEFGIEMDSTALENTMSILAIDGGYQGNFSPDHPGSNRFE
ncbi:MAG: hypothetical protein KC994_13815 [Candidatus Omnitrophica bacterium]|nr:hypothetical protein [Candidatus Omnitrophota bacterium]